MVEQTDVFSREETTEHRLANDYVMNAPSDIIIFSGGEDPIPYQDPEKQDSVNQSEDSTKRDVNGLRSVCVVL